jgi:hypothetical protein
VGSRLTQFYVLAVVLGVAGALAFYLYNRGSEKSEVAALTPEARAYVRNLQLSDVSMKATESYVKQMITEIEGKIKNNGDRGIRSAEVICVFYDSYGQVVLRERAPIVKAQLQAGETRPFRLPFDNVPESWNNQAPQLVIASIAFQ